MGGGKSAPAQTTQTTEVKLPAWVEAASQENYNFAKEVAGRPLEQFEGQTVADLSPLTQRANALAGTNVGSTDALLKQAGDIYSGTAGPLDINSFLNPYRQEVENNAVGEADRSLQRNLIGVNDQARKARAFGGSRHAIESGVTRAEGTRGIGDLVAQLRKSGIDFSTNAALADRSGKQAAAAGLIGTAGAKKGSELQDISSLYTGGQVEQGQNQALIDSVMRKFYEKRDYPLEQLNTRLAALGMSPYGRTEMSTKTGTSEKQGTDWATLGLGIGKMFLPMMMSDRNMKTDIEKLTGGPLPMYAYRYKGDPKTYPKVVGPMAQDVAKLAPKAVKKVGGKKVIDLNNLMEALA